jgi:hypothetical protein
MFGQAPLEDNGYQRGRRIKMCSQNFPEREHQGNQTLPRSSFDTVHLELTPSALSTIDTRIGKRSMVRAHMRSTTSHLL